MSTKESLIAKLKRRASNFTYEDLKCLMSKLRYIEKQKGKSSGSRVCFVSEETGGIFYLHKPHPQKELPDYVIKELIEFLEKERKI